ncbi:premnaspirodiene oxygenase-like [Humulus lupulus]|uniref:premnaspirodiene oxygenase-like n=1 Tax=Humulus lupulus TaxID=3486 RepID=UPI002B407748|nr:premnaspirodiene oxygenase-like [Humulus lupulus]
MSLLPQNSPYIPILISIFLIIIIAFSRKKFKASQNNIAPGPWKLPIIGNLHQLIGPLPHRLLSNLANQYGPIMHLQLGEVSAIVISSPEAAKEILKTHDLSFANRPNVVAADIMSYGNLGIGFTPYGDYWRQMRKICMLELLSGKRVMSFRSIREEEVWSFVDSLTQSSHLGVAVNLSQKLFSLTNDIVARAAFGKKCKDQDELMSLVNEVRKVSGGFDIPDVFPSLKFLGFVTGMVPALKKIHRKLDKNLDNIVNDHKAAKLLLSSDCSTSPNGVEEDIIDLLLKLGESGEIEFDITTTHIKAVAMDIFSAGSETSATTIEWAITELLRHPRVIKKAQAEVRKVMQGKSKLEEKEIENKLTYLKSVIKETLRIHPPVTLIPRESREECEINGYKIPNKTKLLINAWAIGRDPSHWGEDVESFRPERFESNSIDFKGNSFELVPFGGGRRICPGISFGVAVVELVLSQLIYHFDWEVVESNKQVDAVESFGITCRRKNDLILIPTIPFSVDI